MSETGLPDCPECGRAVTTVITTGEQHPESFRLWPCGDEVVQASAVRAYSLEMVRHLGYAQYLPEE